jgi:hypothetical protein
MSAFSGYQSFYSLYQNIMLYGPRPANRTASRGMSRKKKKGATFRKPHIVGFFKNGKSSVVKGLVELKKSNGSKVYRFPSGTIDTGNLKTKL